MDRRSFLSVGSAGGLLLVGPQAVRGSAANTSMRLGLLGCGGRGRTVATAFVQATNTRVVALADLFDEQIGAAKRYFDDMAASRQHAPIDKAMLFRGSDAFRRIAEQKGIDIILLATPDYFHPQHLDAVVEAGRHVYCEKPAAVDVAGCQRFVEIGKRAYGRLSLDVGFEVRTAEPFAQVVKRVQAGAIGRIGSGSAFYHAPAINYPPRPNASALEKRIRNFYWDKVLSGDVIVDQNIHILDIYNWALQAHPVKAVGTCGRTIRTDPGDINDHFAVTFTYPGGAQVNFNSTQFGTNFWDVGCRFLGERGIAEAYYSGIARVVGPEPWDWQTASGAPKRPGNFAGLENAEANKARAFVESITSGKFHNESSTGAESALTAILGRMAAYRNGEVTWDEMIASKQSYDGAVDLSRLQ